MSRRTTFWGRVDEATPGRIVYRGYKPQFIGKIISAEGTQASGMPGFPITMVRVLWQDGTEEVLAADWLPSLDFLIEQTEKKLSTHKATRQRGESL